MCGDTLAETLMKYQQPDVDKIGKREKMGVENIKHPKVFIDYSEKINDAYENLEDYNPTKKRNKLMCDDMITNIEVNEIFKTKCHRSFCKRKKTQQFNWFYVTILFQSA